MSYYMACCPFSCNVQTSTLQTKHTMLCFAEISTEYPGACPTGYVPIGREILHRPPPTRATQSTLAGALHTSVTLEYAPLFQKLRACTALAFWSCAAQPAMPKQVTSAHLSCDNVHGGYLGAVALR